MKEIDFTGQSYSMIPNVEMLENPWYIYKLFEVCVCRRKNRRKMPIPYQMVTHFTLAWVLTRSASLVTVVSLNVVFCTLFKVI